jgi:hypothetical protein
MKHCIIFKTYKAEVENQLERKIKWLRSGCGEKYFSSEFSKFCLEHEIIHGGHSHTHHKPLSKERTAL